MDKTTFNQMLDEFKELTSKTDSLRDFILDGKEFSLLDPINRDLMIAQVKAMEAYLSILSIRLSVNSQFVPFEDSQNNSNEEESETINDYTTIADSILGDA